MYLHVLWRLGASVHQHNFQVISIPKPEALDGIVMHACFSSLHRIGVA
ncbi:hypothetical protein KKY_106 [Pelagibacterium halotolerans B2]|uniref:Uncharacterized protein n=1 Tax=Pelagibacterium halotolerans (strain DSM 22347 / JCM 15775 / CGMCC 1.7692 / B2) TaxID=1082931 RepID=G4RGH7_PELHB|nr:hypothetical protein KKY_106 [Pelagibacterium halotolerans B2]